MGYLIWIMKVAILKKIMEDLSDSGSNYTKLVRTYMSMETCYNMFKHGFNLSQIHTCMPWLSKLYIYWLSVKYNEKPVEASEKDLQHFPFSSIFKRRFFIYLSQSIFISSSLVWITASAYAAGGWLNLTRQVFHLLDYSPFVWEHNSNFSIFTN